MTHYTYILNCSDNTFYTGYTIDLQRRLQEHNSDKSKTKYTKSRRPVKLVYFEEFTEKQQALKRELEIKKLPRKKKFELFEKTP